MIHTFSFVRGDTFAFAFRLLQGGVARTLVAGDVGRLKLFNNDGSAVVTVTVSVGDQEEDGRINVVVPASSTQDLDSGRYPYELEMVFADGEVYTALSGFINLVLDKITPGVRT